MGVNADTIISWKTNAFMRKRMEAFLKESELPSIRSLLQAAVMTYMDNYPWNDDACKHTDGCMHYKGRNCAK